MREFKLRPLWDVKTLGDATEFYLQATPMPEIIDAIAEASRQLEEKILRSEHKMIFQSMGSADLMQLLEDLKIELRSRGYNP